MRFLNFTQTERMSLHRLTDFDVPPWLNVLYQPQSDGIIFKTQV